MKHPPGAGGFQNNITVTIIPHHYASLKVYAEENSKAGPTVGFKVLGEKWRKLGGEEAYERVVSVTRPPSSVALCHHEYHSDIS